MNGLHRVELYVNLCSDDEGDKMKIEMECLHTKEDRRTEVQMQMQGHNLVTLHDCKRVGNLILYILVETQAPGVESHKGPPAPC